MSRCCSMRSATSFRRAARLPLPVATFARTWEPTLWRVWLRVNYLLPLALYHQRSDRLGGRDRLRLQRPLRPGEPDRPNRRRRARVVGSGREPGPQLGRHGHDEFGLDSESLVGAAVAGHAASPRGARGGAHPRAADGVQNVRERSAEGSLPDRATGPPRDPSRAALEPATPDLLPLGGRVDVLNAARASREIARRKSRVPVRTPRPARSPSQRFCEPQASP